jgi:hypothetical protein
MGGKSVAKGIEEPPPQAQRPWTPYGVRGTARRSRNPATAPVRQKSTEQEQS